MNISICYGEGRRAVAYHNSVVPGEDCKVIKSRYQIPPRSDIAGYEDRKSENREGVHESLSIAGASPCCGEDASRKRAAARPIAASLGLG